MTNNVVRSRVAVGLVVGSLPVAFLLAGPEQQVAPPPPVTASTAATPTTGSSSPEPSPTPSGPAPAGAPTTGPGITSAGVALLVRPDTDGSFRVDELVLVDEPRSGLDLAARPFELAGTVVRPVATDVQGTADGLPVGVPDGMVSDPVTVPSGPAQGFALRYRLTGATVLSEPSSAGRALAVLAPLATGLPPTTPVQVVVTGPTVRNLYCPLLPPTRASCAVGQPPRLSLAAPLELRTAQVQLQLDLPDL